MEARTPTALSARRRRGAIPRNSTPALFVIKGRGIACGSWGAPDYVCAMAQGHVCEWAANMRGALRTARLIEMADDLPDLLGPRALSDADGANYHPFQQTVREPRPSGRCGRYCARNRRCELVVYGNAMYCDTPYCGSAPIDEDVVALNRHAFHRLFGRRRHTSETADFRRRASEGQREPPTSPSESEPYSSELVDSDPGAGPSSSDDE